MTNGKILDGNNTPTRSASAAWQSIDGEIVLLRVKDKELLGLNKVGGRIWELADGTHSIDSMVRILADEYQVPFDAAQADAVRFIQELSSLQLIDLGPG